MTRDELTLEDLIAPYRILEGGRDSPPGQRHAHVAALVVDDPDLLAVVAAWSTTEIKWKMSRRAMPASEKISARWRWIWLGVEWDVADIAEASGVGLEVARAKVLQASALRIIYPDGSVNVWAKAAMAAMITSGGRRTGGKRQRAGKAKA